LSRNGKAQAHQLAQKMPDSGRLSGQADNQAQMSANRKLMVLAPGHLAAGANDEEGEAKGQKHQHLFHDAATHLLRSKAQWDKTKPKSRCQCHACGEHEAEGQNYSYIHDDHPTSAMFGAFGGWRDLAGSSIKNDRDTKQTIAIAVKYPMRSAAIVISSITLPQFGTMLQKQTKSCALRHTRDCGRNGIIPGPLVAKRNHQQHTRAPRSLFFVGYLLGSR
jgi:hypothetical protein